MQVNISSSLTCEKTVHSSRLFQCAKNVLAGGVGSSARAIKTGRIPYPLYITHGKNSHIWDVDGNQFIDYLLSFGSSIMGHSNSEINKAVTESLEKGSMFGLCNVLEVELAEQICKMVPCAQLVRFSNSGSEAVKGALRVARGFTGKELILKFEGHYHGWTDELSISSKPSVETIGIVESPNSVPNSLGVSESSLKDVVVAPWNDFDILTNILDSYEINGNSQFAAIICEPVVANNSCIMPKPNYLEFIREECNKRNIILIFDEVVTGFRLAAGGAQQCFNVIPDLTIFSKALGGGFPISAFCGKHEIMTLVGNNTVKQGGTYNSNPLCTAAALATLRSIEKPETLKHIHESGNMLSEAAKKAAIDFSVPIIVHNAGGIFQIIFTDREAPIYNYRDVLHSADKNKYEIFVQSLLDQGIYANPNGNACWFTSSAHNQDDIHRTCEAIRTSIKKVSFS